MLNLGFDNQAQSDIDLIIGLAQDWIAGRVANQPVRMDADTLTLELGHATFGAALSAWRHISRQGAGFDRGLS